MKLEFEGVIVLDYFIVFYFFLEYLVRFEGILKKLQNNKMLV